jgi:hypothetical protein
MYLSNDGFVARLSVMTLCELETMPNDRRPKEGTPQHDFD